MASLNALFEHSYRIVEAAVLGGDQNRLEWSEQKLRIVIGSEQKDRNWNRGLESRAETSSQDAEKSFYLSLVTRQFGCGHWPR